MAGSPVKSFALETSDIVIATATASAEAQAKAAETPVSLRDATLARLRRQDAYFKSKELQLLTIMQTVDSALAENEAKWEKALLTLERLDTIKVSAAAGEVSRSLGDKVEDMAEKAKNAGMMALLEKDGSIRAAKLDACSRAVDACKAQLSQLQKLSQSVTAAKNDDAINALLPGVEAALSHGRGAVRLEVSNALGLPATLQEDLQRKHGVAVAKGGATAAQACMCVLQ